ncbi:MAG: 4Fe-4S binding protein [Planctomycetes bacterium]|nr:4Fe-4S binding protein [Planctomycetota bacterium]
MSAAGTERGPLGRWGRRRTGVQAAALALFAYLALAPWLGWPLPLPAGLFLRFDPLVFLVSSVAGRGLAPWGLLALGLVAATAVFGRVFCGWVCPMGSGMDAVGRLRAGWRRPAWAAKLAPVRFALLLALLGAAVAGANFAGWLDPLAMATRALAVGRGVPHHWAAAAVSWLLVAGALGLALLSPRLWCRALCPLGALLSLAARAAPWRRRTGVTCTRCGACVRACPMGRAEEGTFTFSPPWGAERLLRRRGECPLFCPASQCLACRRCEDACPQGARGFGFRAGTPAVAEAPLVGGHSRRAFALAGLGALGLGALGGLGARSRSGRAPLRPPGVEGERSLAARCVGCGSCLAACPTGGLLPLLSAARPDAFFTPVLVPAVGPCEPGCVACGEACRTGAIGRLAAAEKAAVQIGLAVVDRSRCLPWAEGERCFVCENACPREYGAIEMRLVRPRLLAPHVREWRCTGCGLCEHRCPVQGAIRVVVVHEIGEH